MAFGARGQLREARDCFEFALELNPFEVRARRGLGQAYLELGDAQLDEGDLLRAIALMPHDADAHKLLGNVYLVSGHQELATHCFEQLLEIAPTAYAARTLGAALGNSGRLVGAAAAFRRPVSIDRTYEQARLGLRMVEADLTRRE
jgi:tetratricopeptide (TPR) repeat protein